MITVIGIKIIDRIKEAGLTQDILSLHSPIIITRLGFHEVTDEVCSREAYIILHLRGDHAALVKDLGKIGGIEIREMIFNGTAVEYEPVAGKVEIIGLLIKKDKDTVHSVQRVLTSYGCNIRTRMGVNEMFFGEPAGLIILELKGDDRQRGLLERDMKEIDNVQVRKMVF